MDFSELVAFIDTNPAAGNPEQMVYPTPPSAIIGASLSRVDAPLKTTGTAMYASDYHFPRLAYAVPVGSTIANGSIRSLDTSAAEKMPGVLLILHHGNIAPLFRVARNGGRPSESRPPLEDEVISYWGQYVAVAIAETFQQAQAAAAEGDPPAVGA